MTDGASSVKGRARGGARFTWLLLVVAVLMSLGAGIHRAGVWEPPELEVAEFSRRIGASVFGGEALCLGGGRDQVPTQTELGRGQLPFLSIALGFRVFGLHDWAGRLPLVLWGLLGVGATALLTQRFAGKRAAGFSALVLATMPTYFVQAKTMLGDIVTLSVTSCAICCLAFAVFGGPGARAHTFFQRGAWLFAGAICLGLGVLARGLVMGVAFPLLAVGLSSLLLGRKQEGAASRWLDVALIGGGLLALAFGVNAFMASLASMKVTLWTGMSVHTPLRVSAFDGVVPEVGHGLWPWSGFLPVAVWRLGSRAHVPSTLNGVKDTEVLTVLLIVTLGLCFLMVTLLAPWVQSVAFPATFAVAIVIALGLDDLDAGWCSPVAAACTLGVGLILALDFRNFPEKALTPYMVADSQLPASFNHDVSIYVGYRVLPLLLAFALVLWFARFLPAPGWLGACVLALAGLASSVEFYPALAAKLAPKTAFAAYQAMAGSDEPLGVVGSAALLQARYSTGIKVMGFDAASEASDWLLDGRPQRRFLLLPGQDLAIVDSAFRQRHPSASGLPVLNAEGGSVFLVSNLLQGATNQNPFGAWFSAVPPKVTRPLDANLGGLVNVLGWALRDSAGKVVPWAASGQEFQFVTYYEVVAPITEEWRAFVHLDHMKTRINADHDLLSGSYPMTLWNVGSYVIDIHAFSIDAGFPPGRYRVYLGLYQGQHRLEALRGQAEDDRVYAGELELR